MPHTITRVISGSVAEQLGLQPGDQLLSLQGQPIRDWIDYQFFCAQEQLELLIKQADGELLEIQLEKDEYEPLGLEFERDLMDEPRRCANRCVFCFVDQLPPQMRESLYIKDDDWRLSFLMGNYVTLSNVGGKELARICARRVSPLYISVHATEPMLRRRMLGNPKAPDIMRQLRQLAQSGISFHMQIVLCPGLNDGPRLEKTVGDLLTLRPYAKSLAVVPVGLTGDRQGLCALRPVGCEEACQALDIIERVQIQCRAHDGESFLYAADELYQTAGRSMPSAEWYDDFPQLENGVGMIRLFEQQWQEAIAQLPAAAVKAKKVIVTGKSACNWLKRLVETVDAKGLVQVISVENRYFIGGATVAGLLTGEDIARTLLGMQLDCEVLLPQSLLRSKTDCLLDDMTIQELSHKLGVEARCVPVDGQALLAALLNE